MWKNSVSCDSLNPLSITVIVIEKCLLIKNTKNVKKIYNIYIVGSNAYCLGIIDAKFRRFLMGTCYHRCLFFAS